MIDASKSQYDDPPPAIPWCFDFFVPLACLDTFIRFSGGTPSYTLKILAADTRKVLDSFVVTNSPYLWSIPNAADRLLLFSITDALGVIAESDVFIVQRDSHFDCEDTFPGEASSVTQPPLQFSTTHIVNSILPSASSTPVAPQDPPSKKDWILYLLIIPAVLLVIAAILIVVRVVRKRKRATQVQKESWPLPYKHQPQISPPPYHSNDERYPQYGYN
ncbi:hypothetical protein FRC18_005696 [Serendipita sp. 400]|nr:hypothetical protein FRC18_005696 [Serendipita sp. 400]